MGHASVMITLDRYGHLMPGNEREAAGPLDSFLLRPQIRVPNSAQLTPAEHDSATRTPCKSD